MELNVLYINIITQIGRITEFLIIHFQYCLSCANHQQPILQTEVPSSFTVQQELGVQALTLYWTQCSVK